MSNNYTRFHIIGPLCTVIGFSKKIQFIINDYKDKFLLLKLSAVITECRYARCQFNYTSGAFCVIDIYESRKWEGTTPKALKTLARSQRLPALNKLARFWSVLQSSHKITVKALELLSPENANKYFLFFRNCWRDIRPAMIR